MTAPEHHESRTIWPKWWTGSAKPTCTDITYISRCFPEDREGTFPFPGAAPPQMRRGRAAVRGAEAGPRGLLPCQPLPAQQPLLRLLYSLFFHFHSKKKNKTSPSMLAGKNFSSSAICYFYCHSLTT